MREKIIGPDLRNLHSFQELPIGSTITGIGAQTVPTGNWRFYRPHLRDVIPPCESQCPAGVDIRNFVSLIKKKRFEDAYKAYTVENPFPGTCGQACDHPCEESCLRGNLDGPVTIQGLELFLGSKVAGKIPGEGRKESGRTVALIGNSILILSCAYFLRQLGHGLILFLEDDTADNLSTRISETFNLQPSSLLKSEVERVLEPGQLTRVDAGLRAETFDAFDAVVWGQDAKAPGEVRGLFSLVSDRETISEAIGRGKLAAIEADLYLNNKKLDGVRPHIEMGSLGPLSMNRYLRHMAGESLDVSKVIDIEEINIRSFRKKSKYPKEPNEKDAVKGSMDQQEAIKAAARCFECGKCTFCGHCMIYCPDQAIEPESRQKRIVFDYKFCKGCGICVYECPRGAIGFVKEEAAWQ
jgi:2-oxoacid:acceptor oxidoreductase delta subunit (pyruvate/2-ketoisovalerate family)